MDEVINSLDEAIKKAITENILWKTGDVDEGDLIEISKLIMREIEKGYEIDSVIDDILGDYFYEIAYDDEYTEERIDSLYDGEESGDYKRDIASLTVEYMRQGLDYDKAHSQACDKISDKIREDVTEARAYREELQALSREMDREIYRGLERRAYR